MIPRQHLSSQSGPERIIQNNSIRCTSKTEIMATSDPIRLMEHVSHSNGPAPSAGMRLEVPILERSHADMDTKSSNFWVAGKPARNSARPRCLRLNFIAGGIASMARYSTF
ncbi:hypothetical protein ASPBRDRAFT_603563 [Aspergillus brasiliensis CBS 101740]|uniref:Uncharacterized protein n=1 Tax=Aspergillus brasiliensis (strain CBS 101740 / IMI 381727 / IBT 21946) TaxID=767769 RepID=A0A1L9UHF9_ASPBC|nr:hypothetical protein ASPBRDRAFT_603563 [Aspergillus brasiliensis CBS 101740]